MSKLTQLTQSVSPLASVAQMIKTKLVEGGAELRNKDLTKNVLSFESLSPEKFDRVAHTYDQYEADLQQMFADARISTEGYTDAQWRAGVFTMMAAGDPAAYARKASTIRSPLGNEYSTVIEQNSSAFGYRNNVSPAMEAFDDRELLANLPFSTVFNVQAARQNEFGEAFYQTVTVTPDQASIDITVRRSMIFNEVRHELSGKPMDFHRRNLVEAVIDASLLANQSTRVVPVYVAAGPNANTDKFTTDVAVSTTVISGESVLTRPLKPGIKLNLLGLSQTAAVQATGQLDNTDSLDHRINVSKLYIKIHSSTVVGAGANSIIPFETLRLPRSQFLKSPEGFDKEMMLNFVTVDLPITGLTKDVANAQATALTYLTDPTRAGWIVRLAINVTGQANLELGNVAIGNTPVHIDSVWNRVDADTIVEIVDPVALAALNVELDAFTLVGFDLSAFRSNINRRTRGIQVTTVDENERFTIPLGQPITCPTPVTNTRTSTDMAAPITAARIINDNNAVTKLIEYGNMLSALELSKSYLVPVPSIEGIGRLMIRPFYEEFTLDLLEVTASLKSQDRAADVSSAFVNKIREMSYRAYRDSAYQPALDAATGGTGEKPTLLIGTDPVILRHLIVSGDTRTVSIAFDHKIVTSYDSRVRNKIFMTFVRENLTGPDPLSFGFMGWMPELATNVTLTRNGAVINETMVQPRALHVNTLPILMVINVVNLDKAVGDQLPVYMQTV